MENINKTLKYYDLYMFHSLENIQNYTLPEGYKFVFFKDGDEIEWVKININAGVFLTIEDGLNAFNRSFRENYHLMKERCIFIENANNEKIATSTAYFVDESIGKVHWVAISKSEQGNKLSKPLLTKVLSILKECNYKNTILHTQTYNWLAIKVYLDLGFIPYKEDERIEGWNIIKTILNHKSLCNFKNTDIYDDVFVSIDKFIQNNYKDYEYIIYDKQNIFKVKTNTIDTYSYEYINNELKTKKLGS